MAVLALDTIGCLPVLSKGNMWALTAICLHTSYVFTVPIEIKSAEHVIQAYFIKHTNSQMCKCSNPQ